MQLIRLLKRDLAGEAFGWVEQGLIGSDQAEKILSLYGAKLPRQRAEGRGYWILRALAGLFAGIALIIFVSHNWEQIPRLTRMLSLVGATALLNGIGVRHWIRGRERSAIAWLLTGALTYGASIFLVGQIYHLGINFTEGLCLWGFGVLPLAMITGSVPLMLLAQTVGMIWMVLEGFRDAVPLGFLAYTAAGFWFALRQRHSIIAFLTTLGGLALFVEVLFERMLDFVQVGSYSEICHVYFILVLQLILFTAGGLLERGRISERITDYGIATRLWAMRFGLFTMFLFSFEFMWEGMLRYGGRNSEIALATLAIGAICHVGLLYQASKFHRGKKIFSWSDVRETYLPDLLFLVVGGAVITAPLILSHPLIGMPLGEGVFQMITNVGLAVSGIWFIRRGVLLGTNSNVYLGTFVLLILALFRYFDLIGSYTGTSILFFIEAGIMYAVSKSIPREFQTGGDHETLTA